MGGLPDTDSLERFARFRRLVFAEPELERRLRDIPDWPSFVTEATRAADEHGLVLTGADVYAARAEALQSWRGRWV